MGQIFSYTVLMAKRETAIPVDRVRAGQALAKAIDSALGRKIVLSYDDIGQRMGFHRTMIPQHKNGTRPMSRKVVLEYATVLKCDPVAIADDGVKMELDKDLQRFENDSKSYVVVKEYTESHLTPIKVPRDFIESEGIEPSHLLTVRLVNGSNSSAATNSSVIIVYANKQRPIKSGEMHVLTDGPSSFTAKISEVRGGYIITPEEFDGKTEPTFRTNDEMQAGSLTVVGVVLWRFGKA